MRAFIAIELAEEIKEALASLQQKLKESGADVKWVEPKNIHLTLKFLGEIDQEKLERIKLIIEETAKLQGPFQALLSSLGAYPKIDAARVIWVGIDPGEVETKKIAKALEEKIQKLGIPKEERAFSSHITIGRTRSSKNREALIQQLHNLKGNLEKNRLAFLVNKITLFKSTLTPSGPVYESLKEAILNPS